MTKKQATFAPELSFNVQRRSGQPLSAQLADHLRQTIRKGLLPAERRLPASRQLAQHLRVSRSVIEEAYAQLVAEGYLETHSRSGTRVARGIQDIAQVALPATNPPPPRYDFVPGIPDTALFPRAAWVAALRQALQTLPNAALGYGDARGFAPLREELARYLGRVRGVATAADHITLCSGFAQGVELLCRVMRAQGKHTIAVEEPTHPYLRRFIARTGIEIAPIPVDAQGISVAALAASSAPVVLVTPAHQFPLGVVLAPARRAELLAWARERDGVIVEDDYDAEFRYDRAPIGALQGLAPERVVYVGSVSKTLAPALRIGWLAAPAWLAPAFKDAKTYADSFSPLPDQAALAQMISSGVYDHHLRRARRHYQSRRDLLVHCITQYLPQTLIQGVAAGIQLVMTLPADVTEAAVIAAAARRDVSVWGADAFYAERHLAPPALVLGYGLVPDAAIPKAIMLLTEAIEEARQTARII